MAASVPLVLIWRNLYLVNALVGARLNARLSTEAGCTLLEHDLLAWLSSARGRRMRMLDLARRLQISPGGLTRVADRLVERGWIRRETPESNRREVYAVLTAGGVSAFKAARASYSRVLRETLARHLDASQLGELASVTDTLLERLAADSEERTGRRRPGARSPTRLEGEQRSRERATAWAPQAARPETLRR